MGERLGVDLAIVDQEASGEGSTLNDRTAVARTLRRDVLPDPVGPMMATREPAAA